MLPIPPISIRTLVWRTKAQRRKNVLRRQTRHEYGLLAGLLVFRRREFAKVVNAAMHVRILGGIVVRDGVNDRAGLLRSGGIVEIDERPAMHLPRQNREVAAQERGIPSVLGLPFPMTPTRAYPSLIFYDGPRLGGGYNLLTHKILQQIFWTASSSNLRDFWKLRDDLPEKQFTHESKQKAADTEMR